MLVTEIWRYPIKSVGGEQLMTATVGTRGIDGDRGWGIRDAASGNHLTARREPRLLLATAAVVGDDVVMTLPDGTETNDDATLSSWLGADVNLERATEETSAIFENPLDWENEGDWMSWNGPSGSFHDSGRTMVSLCGVDTARDWDLRRFRQNIWVSGGGEVDLLDSSIRIGSARFDITKRIARCVMVTRPQPGIDRDLSVLRTISDEMDSMLGVGAMVPTPGEIAVGDEVTLSS